MYLIQRKQSFPNEQLPTTLPPEIYSQVLQASRLMPDNNNNYNNLTIPYNTNPHVRVNKPLAINNAPQVASPISSRKPNSVPWAISREEKYNYDGIFHRWNDGTGHIIGKLQQLYIHIQQNSTK
jgi:hypothetical protein